MDSGCNRGGILRLREIASEHPAELAYDLRQKLGLSIEALGDTVSWYEAVLLVHVLLRDPTSWLHAAETKWKFTASHEWQILADVYDLLAAVNSKKKPKPYPRPWKSGNENKIGSSAPQKRSDVISKLDRMNPKESDG